jgi:hypothetical protein
MSVIYSVLKELNMIEFSLSLIALSIGYCVGIGIGEKLIKKNIT